MYQNDDVTARHVKKRLTVEIEYFVGRQDDARGTFEGGVPEPENIDELKLDVLPDLVYSEEMDDLVESGKLQIHLRGPRRAYFALARYLLALTELETQDPDYHDHFDDLAGLSSERAIHLIVHAPTE